MVSSLVTSTGRTPVNVGKPEQYMLNLLIDQYSFFYFFFLIERHNLKREKTCMVGDRLDTDILFGQNGDLKTLVVFTGKQTLIFDLNYGRSCKTRRFNRPKEQNSSRIFYQFTW